MSEGELKLSDAQRVKGFRIMVRIRAFEEKAIELYQKGLVHGTVHATIGQEASSAGVMLALRKDDYVTSTHRGHGHCIAKGARVDRMMAELLARRDGYCKGLGGSMHIADFEVGMLGANGIVAAGTTIATGAGLSIHLRGTDQVAVTFFGDGSVNQGSFHEACNMAAAWKLPVLFVCENNQYGLSTPMPETVAGGSIAGRAQAYGIPGMQVDGQDMDAVYGAAAAAVARARRGEGPSLIEVNTYRYYGHNAGDPARYRTREEVDRWKQRDPIALTRQKRAETGPAAEADRIEAETAAEVSAAVEWALQSPELTPEEMLQYVYATPGLHPDLAHRVSVCREGN